MFLLQRNCGRILEKGRDSACVLPEDERKILIAHAQTYLIQKCTLIEKGHIALVAKTLVFLNPKLKDNSVGEHAGYVCFSTVYKTLAYIVYI